MVFRILFLVFSVSLPFLMQSLTLGFHPAKLYLRLPYRAEWESPPMGKEIEEILRQPFTYLSRGSQSYVFESQDKNYVLKLFRYNRSQFPLIQNAKKWFHRKEKANLFSKMEKTFQAFSMAFREARECTQLLYVHLNPNCERSLFVSLSDPIGRKWKLPIGAYRFALQKKVDPFKSTLIQAYTSKNAEEMKRLLDSFIVLLYERTGKCIRNSDHNLWPNFGFFEGQAIEIDCGNYRKRPEMSDPELRIQEMHRFIWPLFLWLLKNAPEFAPYFHAHFLDAYEKIKGPGI